MFKLRNLTLLSTKWTLKWIWCLLQISKKLSGGLQRAAKARHFEKGVDLFQQDNVKPHTAITTAWLYTRRVRVLNWPACSPDLSPMENIWRIVKRKIRQRRLQTLQQVETFIGQEWDQIPTPKLQKLITSMPRCLQTVLKRRCYTIVNYTKKICENCDLMCIYTCKHLKNAKGKLYF